MDYLVTFSRDVTLYDASNNMSEVRIKKGKHRMINADNPLTDKAVVILSPWIMIRGTKIGISYAAFEKFGFKLEQANLNR